MEKSKSLSTNVSLAVSVCPWWYWRTMTLISDAAHLLMYYDKHFQTDHEFCVIVFDHEQIKDATAGGQEKVILTM